MQVPLMIVGPDGCILECNNTTCRLFGVSDDGLLGKPVTDFLPVASLEELSAFIKPPATDAVIKGMIGKTASGKPVPLAIHMTTWHDDIYGHQHALVLRDITEEIASDQWSKDALKRADNAIKGAHIGVFEYNPIADTVIVSDIWRELLEIEASETLDLQVEWRSRVHPDDLAIALEPISICLEGIHERASCEYRLRSRDGTKWRWMRTDVAVARRDGAGKIVRLIGAMSDITERRTIEIALRRSVEQFTSAFNNSTVGTAIVGMDGRWQRVNPALCDIFGYTEEEMLATDFQTLTHPQDLDADLANAQSLLAGEIQNYQIEKRYVRSNGAVMWGNLSVSLVKDTDGKPEHFLSQIVDVTEQRRLSEMKSEFIATVSHELRTPLTSVLGALTLLASMDQEPFSDQAQKLLYIARENGKRLHALINDILDFETFSASQMRFSLSQYKIINLVEEATLNNLATADKFGVTFHVICKDRSLTAFVDPKRFQQVMTNLLTNAAKFATKNTTIDITVTGQADFIKVSITNEGAGIPPEFHDKIFQPFAQAALSSTREREGTGLGLNITKQIVEQTGGTINFESKQGGKTTFWFTAPVKKPD